MTIAKELSIRSHAAANYLDEVGWTQGEMKADTGQVCATGAVMYCQPQNGDEYIIREVLRKRGTAESWNDKAGRTKVEVFDALNKDITDEELEAIFGPQWEPIVALVRRASALTEDEATQLKAARDATLEATQLDAALDAARYAAWNAGRYAALDAARYAAWNAGRYAAWDAGRYAAWALVVRDFIGQNGFTQEHYDTLTKPWATVIGKVHPDDAEVAA